MGLVVSTEEFVRGLFVFVVPRSKSLFADAASMSVPVDVLVCNQITSRKRLCTYDTSPVPHCYEYSSSQLLGSLVIPRKALAALLAREGVIWQREMSLGKFVTVVK